MKDFTLIELGISDIIFANTIGGKGAAVFCAGGIKIVHNFNTSSHKPPLTVFGVELFLQHLLQWPDAACPRDNFFGDVP